MSIHEQLDKLIYRFKQGGIVVLMTTPPKTVTFSGSTSMRQSPRHRGDRPTMESHKEVPIIGTPTYVNPRLNGAPEVHLVKNSKYLIPLPPMSEDVAEEGELLEHILNLKYQDYNFQDPEKFPQFQADQYMCKRVDPITQDEVLIP